MNDTIAERLESVVRDLQWQGALDTVSSGDNGLTFDLDGMESSLYLDGEGALKAYFVLAYDPDHEAAKKWVHENDDLVSGRVQYADYKGGRAVQFVTGMHVEESHPIDALVATARKMQALWLNRDSLADDLTNTLADEGIVRPPLDVKLGDINTYGQWSWGTRHLGEAHMYMFDGRMVSRSLARSKPFFAMTHSGHGANSYGLNVVTSGGPFAAFLQHGYGGVYMDSLDTRLRINAAYTYLRRLFEKAVSRHEDTQPLRWLLLFSDFRRQCGIVDLHAIREGIDGSDAFRPCDDYQDLLVTAASIESIDGLL